MSVPDSALPQNWTLHQGCTRQCTNSTSSHYVCTGHRATSVPDIPLCQYRTPSCVSTGKQIGRK
eukprot:1039246-Rhodomonas_salina.1